MRGGEGGRGGGRRVEDGLNRARLGLAQARFELAEGRVNRIEVGRIGRQEAEAAARRFDALPGALGHRQIVEDHRLPRPPGGNQDPFDARRKDLAIAGAGEWKAGAEARARQRRQQGHGRPPPLGNPPDDPEVSRGASITWGESGRWARLIEKDEVSSVQIRHLLPPCLARRRVLLPGDQRLFLRVRPRSRSQRLIVGSEGRRAKAPSNQAQSWVSVAAGCAASWAARAVARSAVRPLGRPERGRASPEPGRRRCRRQRWIVAESF